MSMQNIVTVVHTKLVPSLCNSHIMKLLVFMMFGTQVKIFMYLLLRSVGKVVL